jgi:tetratricopeptide (TPR) repeat protein
VALGGTGAARRTLSGTRAPDGTLVDALGPPALLAADEVELSAEDLEEATSDRGVEGETPFIGQALASEVVRNGIDRAFNVGLPSLVAVEGERGAGRTRMLVYASEYAARIAPDVEVLYGACREGGDGPYAPFSRVLLDRFGVTPSSGPAAVRGQMATQVSEALGATDAILVAETTHLLGHVAGVPFPDSPFLTPLEGKPDELRRRARRAVRRLFEGLAQSRPVLLLLDNVHESDADAWGIVEELLSAEAHLAIVVAGSPPTLERTRALRVTPESVFTAPLAPFGEAEVATMLLTLLPTLTAAPESVVGAITHRSRGNPGALRELVIALKEAGLFRETPEGTVADESMLGAPGIPLSAEDALRARIGRLDAEERGVLERAAVVGEVFWAGAVLAQMRAEREAPTGYDPIDLWPDDRDEDRLEAVLGALELKGFVERAAVSDIPNTIEYVFAQAGSRALLYAEQAELVRTARHAAVARFLALRADLARETVASMIAPHFERAGMLARAGRAYLDAAVSERLRMRTASALRLVEKALPLLDPEDVGRRIDALHEYGSLLTTVGRYDEARAAFREMLSLAWKMAAPSKGGAALNRLARIERLQGQETLARGLLDRALVLFRRAGDLRGVASTLDDIAQVRRLQGEYVEALDAAREALDIRRAHADARGEAVSLQTIGSIELARGELQVAEPCFQQALEIRRALGDLEGMADSYNALGILAYDRGDLDSAVAAWSAALSQAREIGDARRQAFLLNNLGEAHLAAGRLDEAERALEEARAIAEPVGDLRAQAEIARNLARVSVRRNDDDAEARISTAIELATAYGSREAMALAQRALGQYRARTLFDASGAVDRRAEEAFLSSIDGFREIGNEKEAARSLAELGFHLVERGDVETARERLREARATFRRIGMVAEAERVERTLADIT